MTNGVAATFSRRVLEPLTLRFQSGLPGLATSDAEIVRNAFVVRAVAGSSVN